MLNIGELYFSESRIIIVTLIQLIKLIIILTQLHIVTLEKTLIKYIPYSLIHQSLKLLLNIPSYKPPIDAWEHSKSSLNQTFIVSFSIA